MAKHEVDWKAILEGTDPGYRRGRALFRRIPHGPRCKLCNAPFEGPTKPIMRALGRGPWEKNPNYCGICFKMIENNQGGAEIEISCLFADVRGSTGLGERMAPRAFSDLINRFYEVAARVVIEREGIVDKFVGDEVVAFFAPALAGPHHAAHALEAARALLRATGHGDAGGPWIPVGAGIHTGIAFVGAVGEGAVTDFTALGDAVNTTARLAAAAGAGEILVTRAAATAAALDDSGFEHRRLELRGRTEPVDVVVVGAGTAAVPA